MSIRELVSVCKSSQKCWDVVAAMLAAPGACSINAVDALGRTALSWAALNANTGLVIALLASGADPAIADADGRTPLEVVLAAPPACKNERFFAPWRSGRIYDVVSVLQLASLPLSPQSPPPPPAGARVETRGSG